MAKANDWTYICVDCGHQVTAGVDFQGDCPKCHGSRWLCHWQNKDRDNPRKPPLEALGGIKPHGGILSQVLGPLVAWDKMNQGDPEALPGHGRPARPTPERLIKELSSQKYSSRAIEKELARRGFHTSYKTIQRCLIKQKQGSLFGGNIR
jgi:DNA-directed RNA polymerase subunit RPC12/RpoP